MREAQEEAHRVSRVLYFLNQMEVLENKSRGGSGLWREAENLSITASLIHMKRDWQ